MFEINEKATKNIEEQNEFKYSNLLFIVAHFYEKLLAHSNL